MSKSRFGFTLIEMLVVIGVIALVLTLCFPYIQQAREDSRRATCANKLKMFGLGIHNYHDINRVIPPGGLANAKSTDARTSPKIGWQVRILPYTEQLSLYEKLNMRLVNIPNQMISVKFQISKAAREHQVPYAMCPDDNTLRSGAAAQSSYAGNLGAQLVLNESQAPDSCDIWRTPNVHYDNENAGDDSGKGSNGSANRGYTSDIYEIAGAFSARTYGPLSFSMVKDGTSNTFFAGEILAVTARCVQFSIIRIAYRANGFRSRGWTCCRPTDALTTNVLTTNVLTMNALRMWVSNLDFFALLITHALIIRALNYPVPN